MDQSIFCHSGLTKIMICEWILDVFEVADGVFTKAALYWFLYWTRSIYQIDIDYAKLFLDLVRTTKFKIV